MTGLCRPTLSSLYDSCLQRDRIPVFLVDDLPFPNSTPTRPFLTGSPLYPDNEPLFGLCSPLRGRWYCLNAVKGETSPLDDDWGRLSLPTKRESQRETPNVPLGWDKFPDQVVDERDLWKGLVGCEGSVEY